MIEEQVQNLLKELQTDVKEALEKATKETAKEGVNRLKTTSPKRTGKYAQGWRQRKNGDSIVIHNSSKPGLTHLLENGYTARNGRRVTPQKHIKKVEDYVIDEVEKKIRELLK